MDEQLQEAADAVARLNRDAYDLTGDEGVLAEFTVEATGLCTVVVFLGQALWCSEDDERLEVGGGRKEPLLTFLRRQAARMVVEVGRLRSIERPLVRDGGGRVVG
jgi:hypothetical protein